MQFQIYNSLQCRCSGVWRDFNSMRTTCPLVRWYIPPYIEPIREWVRTISLMIFVMIGYIVNISWYKPIRNGVRRPVVLRGLSFGHNQTCNFWLVHPLYSFGCKWGRAERCKQGSNTCAVHVYCAQLWGCRQNLDRTCRSFWHVQKILYFIWTLNFFHNGHIIHGIMLFYLLYVFLHGLNCIYTWLRTHNP